MQIIHLNPNAPTILPPHALTIGNFDGVHLGHQAMLDSLKKDAHKQHLASAVMVFEPQPQEFFNPTNPPARLTNFTEKSELLAKFGVDLLIKAEFNDIFQGLSAHAFADVLKKMNTKHLVLGDDFRFGHDRIGDKHLLIQAGFSVDNLSSICINQVRISSTIVRKMLLTGDLQTAKTLLGQDYTITGKVVHGDKIGRTLNFPTANVALDRLKPALHGVFGADILAFKDGQMIDLYHLGGGTKGATNHSLLGAVNLGTRPSVQGKDYRLEVHLPNFKGELYDLTLKVIFKKYLHGEVHYANLNELKNGIQKDVKALLEWHNLN
ncbi:MAG: riboflavin biosynthesis protein RibF [Moraxella sp.]|nr:riboflavin biosynthesis protein RibF [Moraxella sp.]